MASQKTYVPKSKAKRIVFNDGGELIKLGFHASTLIEFIKANTNTGGYINLNVQERREVDQYGNTHSVSLDTWQPNGRTQPRSTPPQPATGEAEPPSDIPF